MILLHQMKIHELYAQLHMAKAITGEYKKRKVTRGDGHVLTEEELLHDTIETATRHIKLLSDCADQYHDELDKSLNNETDQPDYKVLCDNKVLFDPPYYL